MTIVLGVDGGATKTEAIVLSVDGRILGIGRAGASNYHAVGVDASRRNIGLAAAAAWQAAGHEPMPCAAVFLGLAGIVSEKDRAIVHAMAADLELAPVVGVDHDCRIALAGGLSGRPGIVQIAGTGASTFGVNAAGEGWRAGGWGRLLADEGSGYWLGVRAMQAAVAAYDGRIDQTVLLDRVVEAMALADINDIMQRLYFDGMAKDQIAALGPLVLDAAREGDRAAQGIVTEGMNHVGACVDAVARRLGMKGDLIEIALVGGIFNAEDVVLEPLQLAIGAYLAEFELRTPEMSPAAGATILALDLIGAEMAPAARQALQVVAGGGN